MNKKLSSLLLVVGLAAVIGVAAVAYRFLTNGMISPNLQPVPDSGASSSTSQPESTASGEESGSSTPEPLEMPGFTVENADGEEVDFADLIDGRPMVLNFWASWCGPCQNEMPEFYEVWQERGEEISFVMINMTDGGRETRETASAWLAEQGYDFPVYYDVKQDAAASWGIYSLPTTCFLNGEGKLVAYAEGAIPKESLEMGISMITSGE